MVNYYEVTVYTGDCEGATTFNEVFIKLVGVHGQSEPMSLRNPDLASPFSERKASSFTVSCDTKLGHLACIELRKQPSDLFPVDTWFLDKVEVKSSDGHIYLFPIYSWISDTEVHWFCEATGLWRSADAETTEITEITEITEMTNDSESERQGKVFKVQQQILSSPFAYNFGTYLWDLITKDLYQRKKNYCWNVYQEGLPLCINADKPESLPGEVKFSFTKNIEFLWTAGKALIELKLEGLAGNTKRWDTFKDIGHVFQSRSSTLREYVMEHWKDDDFFGYQYLNGINPMKIQCCTALPSNFPVPGDRILHGQKSLDYEVEKGNIFLCDYKNFDGVTANVIHGKNQYLMAPLVLLHKTPEDKMMPVAIQLKQNPGADNPIFYPTDPEYDWLLAKIFVRSADFNEHQLNFHLLRTHLLAEVFTVSLLRNVSADSFLYKLLMPHTRYTLHINVLARNQLISPDGVFTKFAASGGDAMITILKRSLSSLTYSSLCIHDNITQRGLKSVPNFYYRDDGFALWDIIHRFVKGMVKNHYKNDGDVETDKGLQNWIGDIFENGFLSQEGSGIPQKFTNVNELVKFVTMVIFTCSAQHSAVNNGQYDYAGWMPNAPSSLRRPPPTTKGKASEETVLQTLPDISTTVQSMAALWLLSKKSFDFVQLGQYKEQYFPKYTCRRQDFQRELKELSAKIKLRNKLLKVPYTYMDPELMENSVAI